MRYANIGKSNIIIIPEYKIEFLNKSKKIINTIENIDKINEIEEIYKRKTKTVKEKVDSKPGTKKYAKTKLSKKKVNKPRTLWVRRKKN